MNRSSASQTALQIPELLTSVLRCLGPLEWVKCASVCSGWCDSILSRDSVERSRPAEAAQPTATAASAPVAKGRGRGEAASAASAVTMDLWREFAVTALSCYVASSNDDGGGDRICASGCAGRASRCGGTPSCSRSTCSGGAGGNFYRDVCLEGDPAVLGPPLRATAVRPGKGGGGEVEVATVSLRDITTVSLARYRHPR